MLNWTPKPCALYNVVAFTGYLAQTSVQSVRGERAAPGNQDGCVVVGMVVVVQDVLALLPDAEVL